MEHGERVKDKLPSGPASHCRTSLTKRVSNCFVLRGFDLDVSVTWGSEDRLLSMSAQLRISMVLDVDARRLGGRM